MCFVSRWRRQAKYGKTLTNTSVKDVQFSEERLEETRPYNRRVNITEDGRRDAGMGGYDDNAVSGDFAADAEELSREQMKADANALMAARSSTKSKRPKKGSKKMRAEQEPRRRAGGRGNRSSGRRADFS